MIPSNHISFYRLYLYYARKLRGAEVFHVFLFELSSTFRSLFFFSYLLKQKYQFDDFYKIIEYD